MAAITTLATNSFPAAVTTLGVGLTWQEYAIPKGTQYVTIKTVGACYVAWPGMGAADAGAVSATIRYEQGAGGSSGGGERHAVGGSDGVGPGYSVFVAAQSGTTTVVIEVEGD